MKRAALTLGLIVSLLATACGGGGSDPIPLDKTTLAMEATTNTKTLVVNLAKALKFLENSDMFQEAISMMDDSDSLESCTVDPENPEGEPVCSPEEETDEPVEIDATEMANAMEKALEDYIFVDSQLESDDGKYLVYKLDPEVFCPLFEEDENELSTGDAPEIEEEYNSDCEDFLAQTPVRLKFWSLAEGTLDMDLLLGTDLSTPALHLELSADSVALEVDLAFYKKLWDTMAAQTNVTDMELNACQGKIRFELKNTNQDWTASIDVTQAITIAAKVEDKSYSLSVGTGSNDLTINGTTKLISASSDLGPINFTGPYQMLIDSMWEGEEPVWNEDGSYTDVEIPNVTGSFTVTLDGFKSAMLMDLASATDSIVVNGVSLGNGASLKIGSTEVAKITFVEEKAPVVYTFATENGVTTFTTSAGFTAAAKFLFSSVMNDFPELPAFFGNDTITIKASGAEGISVELADEQAPKLVAGKLEISATSAPAETVTVEAGQCFVMSDDEEEGSSVGGHEFLSALKAGSCEVAE